MGLPATQHGREAIAQLDGSDGAATNDGGDAGGRRNLVGPTTGRGRGCRSAGPDQVELEDIRQVGCYATCPIWGDDRSPGICTCRYLRRRLQC